jgi:hypothetical protein
MYRFMILLWKDLSFKFGRLNDLSMLINGFALSRRLSDV